MKLATVCTDPYILLTKGNHMKNVNKITSELLDLVGLQQIQDQPIAKTDFKPLFQTGYRISAAASAVLTGVGLALAHIWKLRTGEQQTIDVSNIRSSAAMCSYKYMRILGRGRYQPKVWGRLTGFYQAKDNRWIQLHCNFPHHEAAALKVIQSAKSKLAVKQVVIDRNAQELETQINLAGGCTSMVRPLDEWLAHPQAKAIAKLSLFELNKTGDSAPEPLATAKRPLSGLRVLDLTRVIAGPMAGRCLAEHGADVMRISSPKLPSIEALVIDTSYGKRAANINLNTKKGKEQLRRLIKGADIFIQAYRPDSLAQKGFSNEELQAIRPGLISVNLSAYSHVGPWKERHGFDTLVQSASGYANECANLGIPKNMPTQALDYLTGYLAAFAVLSALIKRADHGGGYHIDLSLAQTGKWLNELGRNNTENLYLYSPHPEKFNIVGELMQTKSEFGIIEHIKPAILLNKTPPYWDKPPVPLGTNEPKWE